MNVILVGTTSFTLPSWTFLLSQWAGVRLALSTPGKSWHTKQMLRSHWHEAKPTQKEY